MTISNVLTLARILFFAPMTFLGVQAGWGWVGGVYLSGLSTDFIDGKLARATRSTSPFGRAMDSAADKALVLGAMLGLSAQEAFPPFLVFAFALREIIVFGLRTIRQKNSLSIAQINDRLGRTRFFLTHLGLGLLLVPAWTEWNQSLGLALSVVAIAMAYITLGFYLKRDLKNILRALRRDDDNK